ncbi:MerR family transcriptional regulator [Streptococcus sp. DTU_2020_1001019_1_SI_AUS_MUR_006]|uniref:MerR family transcriptional regulator n=1 Tax=Streptococcus TaxID=1301 RepID=UPI0028F054BC|nr:MerR family transcriptional regulator [Streptococcus sp. DTU_2020_1001019_1_SI_AUS_MUR_006]WNS71638.1 MerR family transcriptional regulator [Streptococcus sp. DTU_2020_1001019_1_SI_AUS_MUR_006]
MFSLSKESENSLKRGILKLVENFLKDYLKPKQRITGLMTPKQLKEELEIDYNTLKRWERAGLKRFTPPIEDTRKVFYRIDDILIFLGAER